MFCYTPPDYPSFSPKRGLVLDSPKIQRVFHKMHGGGKLIPHLEIDTLLISLAKNPTAGPSLSNHPPPPTLSSYSRTMKPLLFTPGPPPPPHPSSLKQSQATIRQTAIRGDISLPLPPCPIPASTPLITNIFRCYAQATHKNYKKGNPTPPPLPNIPAGAGDVHPLTSYFSFLSFFLYKEL